MSDAIPAATLLPKEERRLLRGHAWAYRNEFKELPALEDGALLDVFAANRRFVGRAFYQARGGIGARVLSPRQEPIDAAWIGGRIMAARLLRDRLFPGSAVYRWIHGESDGLPGLVADRYDGVVSLETTCAFYARRMDEIAALFLGQSGVRGVVAVVNGQPTRFGEVPDVAEIALEGFTVRFPLDRPQKTGLFLDQRLNRRAVEPFAPGARIFDGHCHAGLWTLHAARAGAARVLAVDTAALALDFARENAAANGFADRCEFVCADVEEALAGGARHDVVIIDPPAFAKGRDHQRQALTRYQSVNRAAMAALEPGGILITSSCSHFVDTPAFVDMLKRAAGSAGRRVWLLEMRGAGPDHPMLLSMPETAYLKCAVLRVG